MIDPTLTRMKTSIHYRLDIDADVLQGIIDKDSVANSTLALYEKLKRLEGVEDVDYDGHFGPHLFIQVEADYDNWQLWGEVSKLINEYIEK